MRRAQEGEGHAAADTAGGEMIPRPVRSVARAANSALHSTPDKLFSKGERVMAPWEDGSTTQLYPATVLRFVADIEEVEVRFDANQRKRNLVPVTQVKSINVPVNVPVNVDINSTTQDIILKGGPFLYYNSKGRGVGSEQKERAPKHGSNDTEAETRGMPAKLSRVVQGTCPIEITFRKMQVRKPHASLHPYMLKERCRCVNHTLPCIRTC
jgi:hypothetical protein